VSALVIETALQAGDRSATRLAAPDRLVIPGVIRASGITIDMLTDTTGTPLKARTDPDGRTLHVPDLPRLVTDPDSPLWIEYQGPARSPTDSRRSPQR
jgi:hypothetical protein